MTKQNARKKENVILCQNMVVISNQNLLHFFLKVLTDFVSDFEITPPTFSLATSCFSSKEKNHKIIHEIIYFPSLLKA